MENELKYDHVLDNNSIKRSITPDNLENGTRKKKVVQTTRQ